MLARSADLAVAVQVLAQPLLQSADHLPQQELRAAQLLVIEVLSESSRTRDLKEKASDYEAAGVREYWAVDPARREITVHRLEDRAFEVLTVKAGRVESTAVPGYWVRVEWLGQRPLPGKLESLRQLLGQL